MDAKLSVPSLAGHNDGASITTPLSQIHVDTTNLANMNHRDVWEYYSYIWTRLSGVSQVACRVVAKRRYHLSRLGTCIPISLSWSVQIRL